ncbi:MAG: hypothetical protein M1818_003732 [Claussenomyces sp. TS43310]|nr:MAG: hypothetical protein M1818_003732 [Claussenomyces sp. TS43310]
MLTPTPPPPTESTGPGRASTPPPQSTDFPSPFSVPYNHTGSRPPPSPPIFPPRPPSPPLLSATLRPPSPKPDPPEVALLESATVAGCLQDVHQILSQYLVTQNPDPATGRLKLNLFHRSIEAAIANDSKIILAYLFFMRIGEPSLYTGSALRARSASVFQVFLNYKWNINQPLSRTEAPPLGYICDDQQLTRWFLDHGADPNAMCDWDLTPMSVAMRLAPLYTIKILFAHGGNIKRGQLLHHALLRDNPNVIELVDLLLDIGAPINAIQYKDHSASFNELCPFALGTPLHYAAEVGRTEIVAHLLRRGADPSIKNTKGRTVLQTAKFLHQSKVEQILQDSITE